MAAKRQGVGVPAAFASVPRWTTSPLWSTTWKGWPTRLAPDPTTAILLSAGALGPPVRIASGGAATATAGARARVSARAVSGASGRRVMRASVPIARRTVQPARAVPAASLAPGAGTVVATVPLKPWPVSPERSCT